MDFCSVVESLRNKSILVTGSTGFLAKVFVEKVLRIQPDVKRVYLLIRAPNKAVAEQRVKHEVMDKDLFNVLRENHESFFESFISGKVTPIVGNVAHEMLGIEEPGMREQLWREVDVIINSSATTNFDERYDVALDTNTLGVKHAMEFAKKCLNLEVFVHVSTAFVAGEKVGLILERPFQMGETLKGNSTLDIDTELKLAKERLEELSDMDANEKTKTKHMKELGLERARLFGWPNTYVFTKAMGEMLLGHLRDHIPLVILRPTIITSTYREPFPGWIEGTRTIDTVLVNYAKGKLKCFVLDPKSIMDIIPCDMVVNAMIMTMVAHSHQSSLFIYHLCSSVRNPLMYTNLADLFYCFFSKQPCLGHGGKPIKVHRLFVLHTMFSFYIYMILRYKLPLQGFRVVNAACCHVFDKQYTLLNRNYNYAVRVAQLYKPYVFFKGRFDDSNSEGFWVAMDAEQEAKMLHFDTNCIDWEDYFLTIHFPGVVKYLVK